MLKMVTAYNKGNTIWEIYIYSEVYHKYIKVKVYNLDSGPYLIVNYMYCSVIDMRI